MGRKDYLDEAGLSTLWTKIKNTFLLKSGDTATGDLNVPHIKLTATAKSKHIEFSRVGFNYVAVPSGGTLAINMTGDSDSTSSYVFNGTELRPGTNKAYSLGTSNYQWNNVYGYAIYENGTALSSKYAGIAVESYFTNGVANNALRLSNTSKVGDTNRPVYFTANGVPAQISYTIGRNVAAGEDVTAYTAGSSIDITNHVVKVSMAAQSSPSESGSGISFIDTVSQGTDGTITATKKTVRSASASQSGVVTTGIQTFAGTKTFSSTPHVPALSIDKSFTWNDIDRVQDLAINPMEFTTIPASGSTDARKVWGFSYYSWQQDSASSNPRGIGYAPLCFGTSGVSANDGVLFFTGTASYTTGGTNNYCWGVRTFNPRYAFDVNGTFGVSGTAKFDGDITLNANNKFLYVTNNPTAGTNAESLLVLGLNASNAFLLGYGTAGKGYDTFLYGRAISLRYGTSRTEAVVLASTGDFTVKTATTLQSTLAVTGEVSLSSHLTLDNAQTVRFKDSGGTVRNVLQLNENNMLAIGYGTSYNNVGYTNIYGTRVDFTIGQSTLKARIDAQGITSYGGVAAMGIADLSIN